MKPLSPPPTGTPVSRLKDRLLQRWPSREACAAQDEAQATLPALAPQRPLGFPSRIAEFLLVFRLKVRRRSSLSADLLERALRVVLVTCKHWFGAAAAPPPRSRRPD